MSEVMIHANRLTKHFGPFAAVQDASFTVRRGQVVAFLGPNGAGKSTTMRMLTGFLAPTSGSATIAGLDITTRRVEASLRIGYLPENGPLYPEMTPMALLRFFGRARGLDAQRLSSRIGEVTRLCGLHDVLERPISKLSKGFRQRVGLANSLLHEPEVLILDEPTAGLDPNQIRQVRGLIRELGRTNTILLSTHILQEVEAVADWVIFIHRGRIVFDDSLEAFRSGADSLDARFHELTGAAAEAA